MTRLLVSGVPEGRRGARSWPRPGPTPPTSTASSGRPKPRVQSDEDQPLQRAGQRRSRQTAAALGPRLEGTGAKAEATRMIARADRDLDERELHRGAEVEVEAHGGIDRDLEGLVGRAAAEQQHDREAGEGEEEDDGGEAGQGAADRRPVDDREALPGAEAEALAGLEPGRGDGVEPGEEDARGEGAVEDDVRGEDAAEAEERDAPAACRTAPR